MFIILATILSAWAIIIKFFKSYQKYVNKKGYKFKKGYYTDGIFSERSYILLSMILTLFPYTNLAMLVIFFIQWKIKKMSFEESFSYDLTNDQLEEIKEEEDTINKSFHLFKKEENVFKGYKNKSHQEQLEILNKERDRVLSILNDSNEESIVIELDNNKKERVLRK